MVDLELTVDLTKASQSDNLDDTVHYGLVFEAVQKQVEDKKYILIERLAGAICEDLFAQFPPIQSIKVELPRKSTINGIIRVLVSNWSVADDKSLFEFGI